MLPLLVKSPLAKTLKRLLVPFQWLAMQLPTRFRITSALAAMVMVGIVMATTIRVLPNPRESIVQGRLQLTESLSMAATTLASSRNEAGLKALLAAVADREASIRSIGLRQTDDGSLWLQAGPHEDNWVMPTTLRADGIPESTENQMTLPVYARSIHWANIEVAFVPYRASLGLPPWAALMLMLGPVCFIQFYLFLGFVLKQLDASDAVPTHVRDVLDNLGVGLLLLDLEHRILLANPVIVHDLATPARKLLGVCASKLPWKNPHDELLPWVETLARGEALSNRILEISAGNMLRTFSVNSTAIQNHEGVCQGVMVTFKDITTLESHKRELAIAKDAAESANHAKSQFLANMSHEIRTPMNAIVGFTDVLRRGLEPDAERQLELLDTIYSSGNHLVELINDVLDLSKIESTGVQLEVRRFSPLQVVQEVITVLSGKANDQGITLEAHAIDRLPETIASDPTRLRQILINLVGNAIKFTQTGGVRVEFQLHQDDQRPQMQFDVIDSGIGMTEEQLAKIFKPFVQADSSVTRRFGGTGLGLSISKRFAEAMGGGVEVRSTEGQGSVFSVRIDVGDLANVPLLNSDDAREALKVKQRKSVGGGVARVKHGHILIVDDTPANVRLLDLVCRKAGLETVSAENGKIAIDRVAQQSFDVILMDMQMPVMDGYTATQTLRNQGVETPIVALTGNALDADRQKCFDVGCSQFLSKPVKIDDLIAMLQTILGADDTPTGENAAGENAAGDRATGDRAAGDNATKAISPLAAATRSAATTRSPAATPSDKQGQASESLGDLDATPALAPRALEPLRSELPTDIPEFQEIVDRFVASLDDTMNKISEELGSGDFQQLARSAHALKGTGGTVGFPQFTEPAQLLERAAHDSDAQRVSLAISELQQLVARVKGVPIQGDPICTRKQ